MVMEEVVQAGISIRRRVPLHTKQDLLPFSLLDAPSPPSHFFTTDAAWFPFFPSCYLNNYAYYLRNDDLGIKHILLSLIIHFEKETVEKSACRTVNFELGISHSNVQFRPEVWEGGGCLRKFQLTVTWYSARWADGNWAPIRTSEYKLMSCRSGGEPRGLLMGRTRCTGEWVRRRDYAVIQILIMTTMSCTHVRTGQLLPGFFLLSPAIFI